MPGELATSVTHTWGQTGFTTTAPMPGSDHTEPTAARTPDTTVMAERHTTRATERRVATATAARTTTTPAMAHTTMAVCPMEATELRPGHTAGGESLAKSRLMVTECTAEWPA